MVSEYPALGVIPANGSVPLPSRTYTSFSSAAIETGISRYKQTVPSHVMLFAPVLFEHLSLKLTRIYLIWEESCAVMTYIYISHAAAAFKYIAQSLCAQGKVCPCNFCTYPHSASALSGLVQYVPNSVLFQICCVLLCAYEPHITLRCEAQFFAWLPPLWCSSS